MNQSVLEEHEESRQKQEAKLFLFLVIFLFPMLAVAIVGSYGFAVWMIDLIAASRDLRG